MIGYDVFIEQIGVVNFEVVFVCFVLLFMFIDVLDYDQKFGEGVDVINEVM